MAQLFLTQEEVSLALQWFGWCQTGRAFVFGRIAPGSIPAPNRNL
jgi:hypothetical protein